MCSQPEIKCRSFRSRLTGSRARHVIIIDFVYVYNKFRENRSADSKVLRTENKLLRLLFSFLGLKEAQNLRS
jgi:hypothetical protein